MNDVQDEMPLRNDCDQKHVLNRTAGAKTWGSCFSDVHDDGEDHQEQIQAVPPRRVLVFGNVVHLHAASKMLHQEALEQHDVKHVVVSGFFVDWIID